ncbi:aluminum-activated malate transporter 2-like isoform X1 [Salvia splendens]|uniref:aluminum-activated malate transporter 2-like isoform X1 n=1 Tax=Salvia splendens TaxID=180675 RepID=UPI001C27FEF8|nr:aluminum-activated malate transporter 2-like isoform X1 [Salvia splendens]
MALEKVKQGVKGSWEMVVKIGGEDPRKIVHAIKVGVAMAAVSLIYYFDLFHDGYSTGSGLYAMWAVNTVAVVFEFSIGPVPPSPQLPLFNTTYNFFISGATIGKGVNRTLATLLGGALGVGAHGATSFAGNTPPESIMLAFIIFFISGLATFGRFIPKLKARNDYFFLIVIVTYGLIAVCTYRGEKLIEMAEKRMSTVLVGYATVLVCCCICPCWAGQDLHTLVATNIHTLANFLEGFEGEYFGTGNKNHEMEGYRGVIESQSIEESLVNFAKWEPRHGKFRYWHPWEHYLKIGRLTRECACKIDALNGCLNSDMKTPLEIREKMKEACTEMSRECSEALAELAEGMKAMTRSTHADPHVKRAEAAAMNLKLVLQTPLWGDAHLLDLCPAATVASLLMQIVGCTAKIVDSVHELATLSKFKNPNAVTDVVLINVPLDIK